MVSSECIITIKEQQHKHILR